MRRIIRVGQEFLPDKGFEGAFEVVPSTVRLATGRAAQARFHMVRKDKFGSGIESGTHRGDLTQHFRAIAVGVDHAAHCLEVTRSTSEALLDLWPMRVGMRIGGMNEVIVGNGRFGHCKGV
jgi:hypothetical protein